MELFGEVIVYKAIWQSSNSIITYKIVNLLYTMDTK